MPLISEEDILYRVIDHQVMFSQPVLNIYWYCLTAPSIEPSLADIAGAFNTQVAGLLDNEQSNQLDHDIVSVERFNIGDIPFYSEFGGTGFASNVADPAPTFQSVGVRLVVGSRQTRPGSKRISGLVEEDTEGDFLSSAAVGTWVVATAGMDDELAITIGDNPFPVVVRKTQTENGVVIQLPLSQWIWQPVTGVQVLTPVRSQVSRRRQLT